MVGVRRLTPDNADAFRDIRLEGLQRHPEAFASSFKEELARGPDWFRASLERNAVFGGYRDDVLLGVAGFFVQNHIKTRHKGVLWGLYVRAAARGTGLARVLVQAVETHAREEVEILCVSVVTSNEAARRLYEKLGFICYGTEPQALRVDGRDYDEALMQKRVR